MRKIFLSVILTVVFYSLEAQIVVSKFNVTFTDKNNSPYSLNAPHEYLSQRAIERRTRQNIPYTIEDLPVNPWYVDSIRNTGAQILNVSKWLNSVSIYTTDANVISKIKTFPFVNSIDSIAETSMKKGVKLRKRRDTMDGVVINDDFSNVIKQNNSTIVQNSVELEYGKAYTQVHMIGTDALHREGYLGQNIVIAVLDAGFYNVNSISVFDSLWKNNQILGTKDFVERGGDVFQRSTHGMSVLSIMGGNVPGQLIGTAPKAKYWLLRSEDADSEYPIEEVNWVCAAEFADSVGADVINSSLGYTDFYNDSWSYTYQDMDGKTAISSRGAAIAASKGIIVVNSAGNSGNDTWYYIGAPGDADNIITVGAVDKNEKIANFSSRGPTADGRIKPTVCALGEGTFVSNTSGVISSGNGTSFAAPIIAGSVACLLQANPTATNQQIINALIASSSRYLNPDMEYGYGIPNLYVANLILKGTKIYDIDKEKELTVFPNPFTDKFQIIFYSQDTSSIDVQIFDMMGKIVYQKEDIKRNPGCNYINILALDNLSKGYYTLKVISEKNSYTTKIMKIM